ncbi:hypothetical protein BOO86_02900 [Mycobacterium sp. CBMA 234]|uniref:DUF488 domain-containing protein n=1 Tax=Mycolicibacterium sp. CBMA 234 TaxID=1918495 RepID=UPI0012DBEE89|nr:DUF488 family protein [Mycolicibacterium sp. CBMA 234]MUL63402.1 hypothetical protein [Mycolicibacterium sp. CBMA 234]
MIDTARVYDPIDPAQPPRVLVDRLWPRGIRKEDPRVGTWMPHVAPSNELRKWYHANPDRFDDFAARYREELTDNEAVTQLRDIEPVTLVTATREMTHSHVPVLAKFLEQPAQ